MVLLTGAGGFVGQAIRRQFRRSFPNELLLAVSRRSIEPSERAPDGARTERCDLRNRSQVARLPLNRVAGLIHVAAATPGSGGDPFEDTVLATANLLAALRNSPLSSVLLISSVSVYDWRTPRPGTVMLNEDCACVAADDYGRSKLVQELLIQAFAGSRLRTCIFRPSSIYGPGMPLHQVLGRWLIQALRAEALRLTGPRGYRQNYVFVEDVAALVCRAHAEARDGVYNLFSSDTLELPALAEIVRQVTGNPHPVEDARQDGPSPRLVFDNSRLVNTFRPSFTPFVEALRTTVTSLKTRNVEPSEIS